MVVTESLRRRLAELESIPQPSDIDLEMLGRVYLAVGSDKAQPIFARLAAAAEERQQSAGITISTARLYLGNLWRLAGEDAQARDSLRLSRDLLASRARASDQRKRPYLFTLLLLGDDDELLAAGAEFGEQACGEFGWAAVETVRARRVGDQAELERRLAYWDELASAEPADIVGRHPSHRDLRVVLRARCGLASATPGASFEAPPTLSLLVEDVIDGEVLGWWGHDVVAANDEFVTLYDTDVRSVAYRLVAKRTDALSWDPAGAKYTSGRAAYVLTNTASGPTATMLQPGGFCSLSGHLLAVERGFGASVHRADGVELGEGRAPVALARSGDAFAIATDDGSIRVAMLGADLTAVDSFDIDQVCSTLAWFPDGNRLACAGEASQTVRTVALPSGEVLDEAVLHDDDPIVAVAVAPSGATFASVGFDGVLGVRDVDRGLSLSHATGERLEDLAWDSTSELIAVLGEHGWFVATRRGERLDLERASSLSWHPTERKLATGRDGRLTVHGY